MVCIDQVSVLLSHNYLSFSVCTLVCDIMLIKFIVIVVNRPIENNRKRPVVKLNLITKLLQNGGKFTVYFLAFTELPRWAKPIL